MDIYSTPFFNRDFSQHKSCQKKRKENYKWKFQSVGQEQNQNQAQDQAQERGRETENCRQFCVQIVVCRRNWNNSRLQTAPATLSLPLSHFFSLLCILLVLYLKYLSHSMQLPHKFRSVWRVDKEEDAELAASVSTAVSLYHCLPLSHYPYPSLSGTATICISIFEHLNINESPQQLQIAVGNSIPRNVGY